MSQRRYWLPALKLLALISLIAPLSADESDPIVVQLPEGQSALSSSQLSLSQVAETHRFDQSSQEDASNLEPRVRQALNIVHENSLQSGEAANKDTRHDGNPPELNVIEHLGPLKESGSQTIPNGGEEGPRVPVHSNMRVSQKSGAPLDVADQKETEVREKELRADFQGSSESTPTQESESSLESRKGTENTPAPKNEPRPDPAENEIRPDSRTNSETVRAPASEPKSGPVMSPDGVLQGPVEIPARLEMERQSVEQKLHELVEQKKVLEHKVRAVANVRELLQRNQNDRDEYKYLDGGKHDALLRYDKSAELHSNLQENITNLVQSRFDVESEITNMSNTLAMFATLQEQNTNELNTLTEQEANLVEKKNEVTERIRRVVRAFKGHEMDAWIHSNTRDLPGPLRSVLVDVVRSVDPLVGVVVDDVQYAVHKDDELSREIAHSVVGRIDDPVILGSMFYMIPVLPVTILLRFFMHLKEAMQEQTRRVYLAAISAYFCAFWMSCLLISIVWNGQNIFAAVASNMFQLSRVFMCFNRALFVALFVLQALETTLRNSIAQTAHLFGLFCLGIHMHLVPTGPDHRGANDFPLTCLIYSLYYALLVSFHVKAVSLKLRKMRARRSHASSDEKTQARDGAAV